jgi:kinesin family protein 23
VRPINDEDNETCVKIVDESNLMLEIPECSNAYRSGQIKKVVYSFSRIFNETTTQKEMFNQLGLPLVKDLLEGKNGLLFSYGVTGSGKTYSMVGNQQEPGILQRCLDTVFNSISFTQAKKYVTFLSSSFLLSNQLFFF